MSVADKKLAKKISIIEAAYQLFSAGGVNMTAIEDVVKCAGVAKGTFYLYFKDKYDLLDQIIIMKSESMFQNVACDIEKKFSGSDVTIADRIIAFTDRMIDGLVANRSFVSLIQKNTSAFYSLWFSGEDSKVYRYLTEMQEKLDEMKLDKDEVIKNMYVLTSTIVSVCCDSILYSKPYSVEEIRPQIHSLIRYSVGF